MSDPLRPMPMSPEEVTDLVERTRAAQVKAQRLVCCKNCRRSKHAERMRRWRSSRTAKS